MVSLDFVNGDSVQCLGIYIDLKKGESLKELIEKLRPNWALENVHEKILSGGLTNVLRGVYEEDENEMVVVKIYGENTDVIIDREAEKYHTDLLGRHKIGPPLLALFSNGICYKYIPGIILNKENVRDPEIVEPTIQSIAHLHSIESHNIADETQYIWSLIKSFIQGAKDNLLARGELQLPTYTELMDDFQYLKAHLSSSFTDTVLCHNDLLLSNFVYNKETRLVTIIDHEYMGYNFQAFDIANHFCEYPGTSSLLDFSEFPSEDYQISWIKRYLEIYRSRKGMCSEVSDTEARKFYLEVLRFVSASHFLWSVWSIYQSFNSKCEFDYLKYAQLKYEQFKVWKHRSSVESS